MRQTLRRTTLAMAVPLAVALLAPAAGAAPTSGGGERGQTVADYWTAQRMANAIPRDLVVDEQGRGYLRRPDGTSEPYGNAAANGPTLRAVPDPRAKPDGTGNGGGKGGGGGGTDAAPPVVSNLDPAEAETIAATHTFSATVVDEGSGVRSVTFAIVSPSGTTSTFSAAHAGSDMWGVTLEGFTTGTGWSWYVVAKDNAKKGGNTTTTDPVGFSVDTGSGGDPGGGGAVVPNAEWTSGGAVQAAAGRLYFEMRTNGPNYGGYVCSGTVATDGVSARSLIITAAHCVYDDANKEFARNVLFIPDQAGTTATGTNTACSDDPYGCWAPTHGVVDDDWADQTWPSNIPWDYAYYVVPDTGAHTAGVTSDVDDALDQAVGSLTVQFTTTTRGDYTHALGYSYSEDPKFMYCAEDLGTDTQYDALWLGSCELSGGASGGPWVQPMDTGTGSGPIVAVNSYGYSTKPGMGAAHLTGSAWCLFDAAKTTDANSALGHVVACS